MLLELQGRDGLHLPEREQDNPLTVRLLRHPHNSGAEEHEKE